MKHQEGKAPTQTLVDGSLWEVKDHFYISCCDCGLRHHVVIQPQKDGVVKTWWYRDLLGSWINRTKRKLPYARKR